MTFLSWRQAALFSDYIACGKLDANVSSLIVKGVAEGCIQGGLSFTGGETAEMPGFYNEGEYDRGFAVGVAEKEEIITGEEIKSEMSSSDFALQVSTQWLLSASKGVFQTSMNRF